MSISSVIFNTKLNVAYNLISSNDSLSKSYKLLSNNNYKRLKRGISGISVFLLFLQ
jgi:hypothetical protein